MTAEMYFRGKNPTIMQRRKMAIDGCQEVKQSNGRVKTVPVKGEVDAARLPSRFFFRFVTQENQYLLANGLQLERDADKKRLGAGFDKALEALGEKALIHGVAWGFWNADHMEMLKAADGSGGGFVALLDERTGEPMVGIQFWRISADKPLYIRIFEADGVSLWRMTGELALVEPKRAYRQRVRRDGISTEIIGGSNYAALPLVPLYANEEQESELNDTIRRKIDAYDVISSDFSDNLERTNDIYWVINNFGGTSDEIIAMLAEINRIKATYTEANDGGQATAEPRTIEVPYQARQAALDLLEKELYKDAMALNMDEIRGGSLTNVAIKTALANLELKVNRYEWQVFQFVQKLLRLIGVETEDIRFTRQTISNTSEIVQDIAVFRSDITRRKALELNPYIMNDEIDQLLEDMDAEDATGADDMKRLQAQMEQQEVEEDAV